MALSPRAPRAAAVAAFSLLVACVGPAPALEAGDAIQVRAVHNALAMIGTPYRYGGASPRGFDCSGLVVYSFARAGARGLPRTAAALEQRARPIALSALRPGDLLFFRLAGARTSHVALYVGDGAFVHAPSSGKRVERVALDHVYWSTRLGRAGRLDF